jgi:3-oxoacyl-[acyl-carrier-protein] synthase-3
MQIMRAQIAAIEYYLPETVLTNDDLAQLYPAWPARLVEEKTGIKTRHIAGEDETAADMAIKAAQKLFDRNICGPDDIEFVLLCTQSPDYFLPTSACLIQNRLRIPKTCGAFDFNLGCSGFVYGLAVSRALIENGLAANVLLLTADTYSKYIHPMDRSVRTLFGDAATATLVRRVETNGSDGTLIGPFVFGTDGSGADLLIVPAGGLRLPCSDQTSVEEIDEKGNTRSKNNLLMNGPAILTFSMSAVPALVEKLLLKSGMDRDGVDTFVFHQANKLMLDVLRKQCNIPSERFVVDLNDKGNTVGSTIPIALTDAFRAGKIKPKARVMLVGFGVGLSWAGALTVLPECL